MAYSFFLVYHVTIEDGIRIYVEGNIYLDGSLLQPLDFFELLKRNVQSGSLYLGPALFDFRYFPAHAACVYPVAVSITSCL